jgi:lathosterol oxidase
MSNSSQYLLILFSYLIPYTIITCSYFLIFYKIFKKYFSTRKILKKDVALKDYKREIIYSLQTILTYTILSFSVFFTPLNQFSKIYFTLEQHSILYSFSVIFVLLIAQDTYFYWVHRLMHHPKIFKYTHLIHHKSTNPTPFAAYSFNAIEAIIEGALFYLFVFFVPMYVHSYFILITISLFVNTYGHLGFEIMPRFIQKSFFFKILITSTHHNMHHQYFNGNYGLYFRFWDKIMKTEFPNYENKIKEIYRTN